MNWLSSSALMGLCSIVLYLAARKSALVNNSTEYTNLSMYLAPTLIFIFIAISQGIDLRVSPFQFFILLVFSVCFSWLGNVASLKSIELAPNPGYSLVISKSYVVMTTLLAVLFFNAEISLKSSIAIATIILGMGILSIGKPTNTQSKSTWLPLSLLAFVCWGMLSLTSKYLVTIGVDVITLLVYSSTIVTLLIIAEIIFKKKHAKPTTLQLNLMLVMGVAASGFDYSMQTALKTAPNIGFVNAINAGSIAVVTICAAIFFKDELTAKKLIGVLVAIAGLIVLVA